MKSEITENPTEAIAPSPMANRADQMANSVSELEREASSRPAHQTRVAQKSSGFLEDRSPKYPQATAVSAATSMTRAVTDATRVVSVPKSSAITLVRTG